jgi:predicted Fe-Mo cluster-binding NifX family protein
MKLDIINVNIVRGDNMKICITSQGDNLDAQVDPLFGRCQYFLIIDTDTLECEGIKNPNIDAKGGAGIQSGQLMANKSIKVVLTGNIGPNAFQTLQKAGIQVFTGISGNVKEAIEKFKKGELKTTNSPTAIPHSGMSGG